MSKVPEGTTLFITMKRCINCWQINDLKNTKCSQCNYLFLREATPEEQTEAMDKLVELKAAREEHDAMP